MQIHNACPTGAPITYGEHGALLACRTALLNLDLCAIQSDDSKVFEEIKRRCVSCSFREACALDLKRDPNSPVWEAYCPNSAVLFGFTEAWWLGDGRASHFCGDRK
jgi:hypothetical protein